MAYLLSDNCTKYYSHQTTIAKDIVEGWVVLLLQHSLYCIVYVYIVLLTDPYIAVFGALAVTMHFQWGKTTPKLPLPLGGSAPPTPNKWLKGFSVPPEYTTQTAPRSGQPSLCSWSYSFPLRGVARGCGGCGPHQAALATGANGRKLFLKNSRENSDCNFVCVCVQ